jgi:cell shape-determining protein MreC
MTNYLRGNTEKKQRRSQLAIKVLLVIFGISVGLLMDKNLVLQPVATDIEVSVIAATKSKKELAREVVSLQDQKQRARLLEDQYKEATRQIQRMEASFGRLGDKKSIVMAAVTTRIPGFDSVWVDQGEMSGLRVGNPVFRAQGLIGEVTSLRRGSAQVSKLSRSNREISGLLPGGGHITLHGKGGDTFHSSIHRDVPIKEGDKISGLLFGDPTIATVVSITVNAQDPFQKVVSSAPAGLNKRLYVEIDRSVDIRAVRNSTPVLLEQVIIPEQENPREIVKAEEVVEEEILSQ